jgi:hypothetical protein
MEVTEEEHAKTVIRSKNKGRRMSSLSKGFGISVIDTSTKVQNGQNSTDPTPADGDADTSILSENSIPSVIDIVNSSLDHDTSILSALSDTDLQNTLSDIEVPVDISLSTITLRRSSFNKNKPLPSSPNLNQLNSGYEKKQILPQRFRSTPSLLHSPQSKMSSPTIPLPKSNTSSPYLSQYARNPYNHKSQTVTRLPRRRSTQQLTKKQKDKLYDDDNDDTFNDNDHDIFMYNVPIASASSLRMFQHGNEMQSKEALRKAWNESESNLIIPPSPLPGKLAEEQLPPVFQSPLDSIPSPTLPPPVTPIANQSFQSPSLKKNPSFGVLSPTAQQLSTFYEYTSHNQAEDELRKRKQQSTKTTADPLLIKTLDDLSMASAEKLSKLSVTRPSWIPPKNEIELHNHEKQFKKMIQNTSKQALKNSKHQIKIEHDRIIGDARLKYLSEKSILTTNNCGEVRKYILVTDINRTIRYSLFRKLLTYKLGPNAMLSPPFQKKNNTKTDIEDLEIEPLFKNTNFQLSEFEISCLQTILQPITRPIPSNSVDVNKLPKIPALPVQTFLTEFAKISLVLLRSGYTAPQVRDIIYWLHAHIFTVKFKDGFTKLLSKHSVTKLFKEFKDDYSILTVATGLDVILDLPEKVICKCIELLLVFWCLGGGRGVKMFSSIIICIIRDYHFGWNNLQVIFHSKAHVHIGESDVDIEKFFGRVLNHYALIG